MSRRSLIPSVLLLVVGAWLAASAPAPASTLGQARQRVTVSIDATGDAIDIRPDRLTQRYRFEGENPLVDDNSTCDPIAGDPTGFLCGSQAIDTEIAASPAADAVAARCRSDASELRFDAGAGDDRLTVDRCRIAAAALGDGNDTITASTGADTLSGDAGRDTLHGGDGPDQLSGGLGRDLLDPGLGSDILTGGPDTDTASYEDRTDPVALSLDGLANDGHVAEHDQLLGDIEDLIGGAGDDTLTGDTGPNDIDGNDGGDVIDPGSGPDVVNAGTGNDRISARDGVIDIVYCGEGNDQAIVDTFDAVADCETVQASRDLMADIDADGIPAPADCNDRNPGVRPGLRDRPGNRIDEDCSGRDAAYPRVVAVIDWEVTYSQRTRFTKLKARGLPPNARVELRCRGGRSKDCFAGLKRLNPHGQETMNLGRALRRRSLAVDAELDVRILAPDSTGKVLLFATRRHKPPRVSTRCLTPGQHVPHACR